MKTLVTMAALLIASAGAQAQKLFTLEDLNFGGKNYKQMTPERIDARWYGNDLILNEKDSYFRYDLATGKKVAADKPANKAVKAPEGFRVLEWNEAGKA